MQNKIVFTPSYEISSLYKRTLNKSTDAQLPKFISFEDIPKNLFILSPNFLPIKTGKSSFYQRMIEVINETGSISEAILREQCNKNSMANNRLFTEQEMVFKQLKKERNLKNISYIKSVCPNLYEHNYEVFFESIGIKPVNEISLTNKKLVKLGYQNKFGLAKDLCALNNQKISSFKIITDDYEKVTSLDFFGLHSRNSLKSSECSEFSLFIAIVKYFLNPDYLSGLSILTHPHYKKKISDLDLKNIRASEYRNLEGLEEIASLDNQFLDLKKINSSLNSSDPVSKFLNNLVKLHKSLVEHPDNFNEQYSFLSDLSFEIKTQSSDDICENFPLYLNSFSKYSSDSNELIVSDNLNSTAFEFTETIAIDDDLLKSIQKNYKHLNANSVIERLHTNQVIIFHQNNSEHSLVLYDEQIENIDIIKNETVCEVSRQPKPEISSINPITRISMSGIEKLIRNPYIFALQYILKLRPLSGIFESSTEKNFGILVHDIIAAFNTDSSISFEEKFAAFEPTLNHKVSLHTKDIMLKRLWNNNLKLILEYWDQELKHHSQSKFYFEAQGKLQLGTVEVSARADLIRDDIDKITIIDFKTGTIPSNSEVNSGFFPQLLLEGYMAINNGFKNISPRPINLSYVKLSAKDDGSEIRSVKSDLEVVGSEVQNLFNKIIYCHRYFTTLNDFDPKILNFKHLIRKEEWFDQF